MEKKDCKTIGGITFNQYDILKHHLLDKQTYAVRLKDGTILKYKEQDYTNEAEVHCDPNHRIDFKGINNAEITDTSKNDVYRFMGCQNITLYAERSTTDTTGERIGSDSDFIEVTHRRLSNGQIQYSKNNKLLLNKGDLYVLPEDTSISSVGDENKSV